MTGTSKLTLQATSYAYDSENQLKQVSLPGGPVFAAKYDGLGRRIEKSTGAAAGQTTGYIYDAEDIVAMLDGNNGRVAVFTHGPGIDEPLMMRRTDGQEFFMHADGLGSIVAHADGAGVWWRDWSLRLTASAYSLKMVGRLQSRIAASRGTHSPLPPNSIRRLVLNNVKRLPVIRKTGKVSGILYEREVFFAITKAMLNENSGG